MSIDAVQAHFINLGRLKADRLIAFIDGGDMPADRLLDAVHSLLEQVDEVRVATDAPALRTAALSGLVVVGRDEAFHADADRRPEAFTSLDDRTIVLLCRPDLRYPADYARTLVAALASCDGQGVVGMHGTLVPQPIGDLSSLRVSFPCWAALPAARRVHLLHTGLLAFHWGRFAPDLALMQAGRSRDWELAIGCAEAGIALLCVARPPGWLAVDAEPIRLLQKVSAPAPDSGEAAEVRQALDRAELSIAGRRGGVHEQLLVIEAHTRTGLDALVAAATEEAPDSLVLVIDRTPPMPVPVALTTGPGARELHWLGARSTAGTCTSPGRRICVSVAFLLPGSHALIV